MNLLRGIILLVLVIMFSALTGYVMFHQSPSDIRENQNWTATFLTISGPFTGAIARPSQPDCLRFGWRLLPYCAPVLAAGIVLQICPLPFRRGQKAARISAWIIGWLGWLVGGVISLLYALS